MQLRRREASAEGAAPPSLTGAAHDLEKQARAAAVASRREARPIPWLTPFYGGLGAGLALCECCPLKEKRV
jgi:hypothetical protein